MDESILGSIKTLLDIDESDTAFDTDIIMHINSVFMILTQIGVGPVTGFTISDDSAIWSDFIDNIEKVAAAKSWTYMKVKLLFDPPLSSTLLASMERMIAEFEWRLTLPVDSSESDGEEESQNGE